MRNFGILKDKSAAIIKKIKDNNPVIVKFVGNILLQKLVILFFLSFFAALLLTPQIHFKHPEYEAGAIATSNIKADRDFLVEKKVATEQKRMEVTNDIPSVYDYDSDVAARIIANLTKAFSIAKEINWDTREGAKEGLEQIKRDFENSIGITLSYDEFDNLYRNKFSPSTATKISELIRAAYRTGMITNVTFLQQEKDRGITVRDIRSQTDKEVRNLSPIRHIKDIELSLKKKYDNTMGRDKTEIGKIVAALSVKLIQPNLIYNKNESELRKQQATRDVKPVFFKVQKNEMLVREGELITGPVLDKLEAYYRIKGQKMLSKFLTFTGMFFTVAFLGIILYYAAQKWLKSDNRDLLFLCVTALLQILLVRAGIFVAEAATEAIPRLPEEVFIFPIPFAAGAMLVSIFTNPNLALILSVFSSILITFLFDGRISLFLFSFLGSVAASYRIVDCRERSACFKVGFFLGVVNIAVIIFLSLLNEKIFTFNTLISLMMGFLGGIVSGILVAGLTPLFENLFHYTTDIKLLELANLNQPVFQRMIVEAPGTYHHSIIVASLVEAAAETIGANSLLTKVSAYYHDIGKMKKPQYFIENQQNNENKHDKLTPKMSSLVIISHVKDGCELAAKLKLGAEIVNIIRQHHGTSLVTYFYEKAKKDKDRSIRSLPETDFRYPGPKPQTREAGLVLLGDVLEASSRSLSNPTPARIKTLVRERIERVFSDGQLDECELTLHDLNKIAESFTMILNGIFHHRIDYPEPVIRVQNGARKENGNGIVDRKPAEKNKSRSATVTSVGK